MESQKPSRLELYIEILRSLEKLKVSNIISLQEATNIGHAFLHHAMAFLEKQDLIKKENIGNEVIYTTTPRGGRVAAYFGEKPCEEPQELNFA
jgi:predicted transcriptional regulator